MAVKHLFASGKSDGADATLVQPSNWNAAHDTPTIELPASATPTSPATDFISLFGRKIANRMMTAQVGPQGLDTALQPLLARNKVGFWCPPGNSTTVPGVLGYTAHSLNTATATSRTVATTNVFSRMRRLGYVGSVATAGTVTSARVAVGQITTGITIGAVTAGGFFKVIRFGASDAATVSGARSFYGIGSTSAPTNVEPSTLLNSIGVGNGTADTNLSIFWGGSTAQTPIALGANFPANTLSVDVYELALFSAPGNNTSVGYQVTRLNTGDTASGVLTGTAGTAIPSNTTLLSYSTNWRSNNATALACAFDIFGDYIETDQ
jgi:hypothetical protein